MGKIDKEQEQDAYDRLMKGDFVNDGRDNDIVMQPIQLPKANLGTVSLCFMIASN